MNGILIWVPTLSPDYVGELDLNPAQREGLLADEGVLNIGRATLVARRQEVQSAIKSIVDGAYEAYQQRLN